MRLTNKDRELIISEIISDIPQTDYKEIVHNLIQTAAIEALPQKIKEIYDDESLRVYLGQNYIYVTDPFNNESVTNQEFKLSNELLQEIHEYYDKYYEQSDKIKGLRSQLTGLFSKVTTFEKALEKFPEFEKYINKISKSRGNFPVVDNLPVSNVLSQMINLGWKADAPNT